MPSVLHCVPSHPVHEISNRVLLMEILFISFLSMKNREKEAVSPKLNIKKVNSKLPDRLIQIFRSNSKVWKLVTKVWKLVSQTYLRVTIKLLNVHYWSVIPYNIYLPVEHRTKRFLEQNSFHNGTYFFDLWLSFVACRIWSSVGIQWLTISLIFGK